MRYPLIDIPTIARPSSTTLPRDRRRCSPLEVSSYPVDHAQRPPSPGRFDHHRHHGLFSTKAGLLLLAVAAFVLVTVTLLACRHPATRQPAPTHIWVSRGTCLGRPLGYRPSLANPCKKPLLVEICVPVRVAWLDAAARRLP